MKLFETSLLELPLRLLAAIFPNVKEYYAGNYRNTAGYEHCWTGFIIMAFIGLLMAISTLLSKFIFHDFFISIRPWLALLIAPAFFMHVIWKEVIYDAPKRTTEAEKKIFWVNLIERTSGFVFGAPFLI